MPVIKAISTKFYPWRLFVFLIELEINVILKNNNKTKIINDMSFLLAVSLTLIEKK